MSCVYTWYTADHATHSYTAYTSRKDVDGRLPIHYLAGQPDVHDLVDLLGEASVYVSNELLYIMQLGASFKISLHWCGQHTNWTVP